MALRLHRRRADKRHMNSSHMPYGARDARHGERGQAVVEFALILPIFVILVAGIIKFGIAINFWLDMQRVSNQGARYAAVNAWPGCPRGATSCTGSNTLQSYLAASNQKLAQGEDWAVNVCLPTVTLADGTTESGKISDPVTVTVSRRMNLGIPFLPLHANMKGKATMRLEQAATNITANPPC